MDIAIVNASLRIKTKSGLLLIDPQLSKSEEADVAIFLDSNPVPAKSVRLNITGPGEFEVSHIKVTSMKLGDSFFHLVDADGLRLGIGRMTSIEKFPDRLGEFDIAIVKVDSPLNMGSIGGLEPKITVLYDALPENLKSIGSNILPVSKLSTTAEKLPPEMQTVVLK